MQILTNKNSNRFCGPAALAALTGIHVDEAARTLRVVSGKRAIKGAHNRHMIAALHLLGHETKLLTAPGRPSARSSPTLTQALRGVLKDRPAQQRYLVVVTGHYVTIQGRKLWDNKHPEGIALTACPYRRKRVRAVWTVDQVGPVAPPPKPVCLPLFAKALAALGVETDGQNMDAPVGFRFSGGSHGLAITGTYEEALARLHYELPLVPCPADCDCQE